MLDLVICQSVFKKLHQRYETIFTEFRPSRKGVGFTEINLTHNFINALKEELKESELVEWLEFPWTHDGSKRIDGLVLSKKDKWIMYIEAKRFQEEKQVKKLNADLQEIKNFCRCEEFSEIFRYNHGIDDIKTYRHYMVAIADVWTQTGFPEWKIEIPFSWKNPVKFNEVFPKCGLLFSLLNEGETCVKSSKIHTEYHQLCAIREFKIVN